MFSFKVSNVSVAMEPVVGTISFRSAMQNNWHLKLEECIKPQQEYLGSVRFQNMDTEVLRRRLLVHVRPNDSLELNISLEIGHYLGLISSLQIPPGRKVSSGSPRL